MTITYRLVKGSAITAVEHDATFTHIENSIPISVKNYGAVGNGVTDDTAAISNADTAVTSSGLIFFPTGTYLIAGNLVLSSTCNFNAGARLSVASGKTVTFNGPVLSFSGTPTTGSGTTVYGSDGNVIFNVSGASGGFGFGVSVPIGTDHFFSIQRDVDTSVGILVKNQHTGSAAETFLHLFSDTSDSGGSLRMSANSIAGGSLVDIVASQNSVFSIIQASNAKLDVYTNNVKSFSFVPTNNTVNFFEVRGAASLSGPVLRAAGSDDDINIFYDSKGTFGHFFRTGGGTLDQVFIAHTASADRYLQLTGSSGGNPTISASAGSVNIGSSLQLSSVGAFAASDKYLVIDTSGNVHVSALGPLS